VSVTAYHSFGGEVGGFEQPGRARNHFSRE
jgi:hypothetical protein